MTPQILIQALTTILSELPHLLGSSWLEFNHHLMPFLEALERESDPEAEEEICEQILSLFSEYPVAQDCLLEVVFDTRGGEPLDPEMRHGLLSYLVELLQQQQLYALTISSPSRVNHSVENFPIAVSLKVFTNEVSNALYFTGSAGQLISIELSTADFQVIGDSTGTLPLKSGHESSKLTFLLKPFREDGREHQVRITAIGQGQRLGTHLLNIVVHP